MVDHDYQTYSCPCGDGLCWAVARWRERRSYHQLTAAARQHCASRSVTLRGLAMLKWVLRPEVGNQGQETDLQKTELVLQVPLEGKVVDHAYQTCDSSETFAQGRAVRVGERNQRNDGARSLRIHASLFGRASKLLVMRWSSCVCGLTVLAYPSWYISNVVRATLGRAVGATPCTAWWEGAG